MNTAPPDPHRTEIKVRFYELDPYDHLNHTIYVAYFETARIEFLESVGFGLGRLNEMGFRIVVSQIEVDFMAPVIHGDRVVVETAVVENRRASSRWHQRMYRDGEMVAELRLRAAITDVAGKPARFPEELRIALES
ncbi:MAG: acyl-CoA thioesterase [Acidimicrobiia bacterium]|nr:acyl-CoA thioesterase [Acidimicrobiia bacterium]